MCWADAHPIKGMNVKVCTCKSCGFTCDGQKIWSDMNFINCRPSTVTSQEVRRVLLGE
jgi:hypothetical protein